MNRRILAFFIFTSVCLSDEIDTLIKVNEKLIKTTKDMRGKINDLSLNVNRNRGDLTSISEEIKLLQDKKGINNESKFSNLYEKIEEIKLEQDKKGNNNNSNLSSLYQKVEELEASFNMYKETFYTEQLKLIKNEMEEFVTQSLQNFEFNNVLLNDENVYIEESRNDESLTYLDDNLKPEDVKFEPEIENYTNDNYLKEGVESNNLIYESDSNPLYTDEKAYTLEEIKFATREYDNELKSIKPLATVSESQNQKMYRKVNTFSQYQISRATNEYDKMFRPTEPKKEINIKKKKITKRSSYNKYIVYLGYFKYKVNAKKILRKLKKVDKNVRIYKKNNNPKGFLIKLSYNSTWTVSKRKLNALRKTVPDLYYKKN